MPTVIARASRIGHSGGAGRVRERQKRRSMRHPGCVRVGSISALAITPRNITRRHRLLTDFLKLLGLDDEVIYHDVEGMEHHISPPTLRAIEALTAHLQRQPALLAKVRRQIDED